MITRQLVFPWLPVLALAFLCWLLAGCSTVKIKACLPGAAECTVATFRGDSSLESPFVEYERCEGNECVRLKFSADSTSRQAPSVSDAILEKLIDRAFPVPE